MLERDAEITTRYGGGFVQSIDGLEADERFGRSSDWFFYVNGVESTVGAADYPLHGGEAIWWDYRDWSAAMRVPAVVGSWPQPFLGGYDGERRPVAVECLGGGEACGAVRGALAGAGVGAESGLDAGSDSAPDAIRILVGPWARLRQDAAAAQIEDGPQTSGVFARFERGRNGLRLVGLGVDGVPARIFGPRAGLVAATRRYDAPPTWLVTGVDRAGVQRCGRTARRRRPARPLRGGDRRRAGDAAAGPMRSPFAYAPRRGPLQSASPGAAVAYLGALVAVAFLYSSPIVLAAVGIAAALAGILAGARGAVRAAIRLGLAIALPIVVVNALVVNRGETVLARLGEWPLLGQVNVTAEAIADGAVFGLRAVVVMIAFAVYSACVDPDRVLRALRPVAGRSALTATLISRLVPVAAADAARLRDAGRLRGPAAAPLGRAALIRRLLAGSLDRAVDVAATLELRGYSLTRLDTARGGVLGRIDRVTHKKCLAAPDAARGGVLSRLDRVTHKKVRSPHQPPCVLPPLGLARARKRFKTRYDARFYATALVVLVAAIAGKLSGVDSFHAYPTIQVGLEPATVALSALIVLSGLAPRVRTGLAPRRRNG